MKIVAVGYKLKFPFERTRNSLKGHIKLAFADDDTRVAFRVVVDAEFANILYAVFDLSNCCSSPLKSKYLQALRQLHKNTFYVSHNLCFANDFAALLGSFTENSAGVV